MFEAMPGFVSGVVKSVFKNFLLISVFYGFLLPGFASEKGRLKGLEVMLALFGFMGPNCPREP